MPTKIETETQLARVLGNTPIQIELELIAPSGHVSKNTSQAHMLAFYKSFDEVRDRTFDGLVITGAPVENLPFEEVDYWPELCEIMEWSKTHVHSTLHICWGAQAGLYYHYGIPKRQLPEKLFGVFRHTVEDPNFILFRGFDDEFWVPQLPAHHSAAGGHRGNPGAEDTCLLPGGRGLRRQDRPGPADLPHGPRGVRPGHPAE